MGFQATRTAIAQRLAADEAELANAKTKSSRRKQLQTEIAGLKDRLDHGDFRTGDLIVVTVSTAEKPARVDTSTVRENGMISISTLPDVSVSGALRSEVQDRVTQHVAKYIRFPQVRVNFTTRVMVTGAVARPGTYNLSPDRPLTEVITAAGGGMPNAKLDQLQVRRGGREILSIKESKRALVEGRTLQQVGIEAGDEVYVPAKHNFNWGTFVQTFALITTLTFALIQFLQYYYSEP